jgi:hypothetical protein
VVAVLDAGTPAGALYRLGWEPDPLAWPPWQFGCWAIFERARFTHMHAAPLSRDDPDLRAAAQLLSLRL